MYNCIKLVECLFFYWCSVNNFELLLTNIQIKYFPFISIPSYIINL